VVHAALAYVKDGYETIIGLKLYPETVSLIPDHIGFCTSSVTLEDVLEIVAVEKPIGVMVQYGATDTAQMSHGLERMVAHYRYYAGHDDFGGRSCALSANAA